MRFYYTCEYVVKGTRRLGTMDFPDLASFESALMMWNKQSRNTSGDPIYKYTEGTPEQLALHKHPNMFEVGGIDWLQFHAQKLHFMHQGSGNARATDYLLAILKAFQEAGCKVEP